MVEIEGILIFEMLGRPPEHLEKTLKEFVEKISKEQGVEILNRKINKPKKIEDAKQELYTSFAETEMKFKDITSLLRIVFMYLPSHIEIINPEEIRIKNFEITTLMTEIARKLHQYDEIAKGLTIERNILQGQLQEIVRRIQQNQQNSSVIHTNVKPSEPETKSKAEKSGKKSGKTKNKKKAGKKR